MGIEQPRIPREKPQVPIKAAQNSGALGAPHSDSDTRLAKVVDAWPALSDAAQEAILKIVSD